MASERTILLTNLDPTGLGKGKRDKEREFLEKETLPYL